MTGEKVLLACCLLLARTLPLCLACVPASLPTVTDLMAATDSFVSASNLQWIFPSIQFTCSVNVTAWVFRVAKDNTMQMAQCPTLELWENHDSTPITTDYTREVVISDYSEPQRLSAYVFRCNLSTPLTVQSGSVLGFSTVSPSNGSVLPAELTNQNGIVGFRRSDGIGSFYDTSITSIVQEASGVVPLMTPIYAQPEETGVITSTLTPSTPLPYPYSTPSATNEGGGEGTLLSPSPTLSGREGEGGRGGDSAVAIAVAVPLCIGLLLLVVTGVVVLVLVIVFIRHRGLLAGSWRGPRNSQPEKHQEGSTAKVEQGFSLSASHDYEDVDKMGLELSRKHDYDVVDSGTPTVWAPNGYEVPHLTSATMGHIGQANPDYEVPDSSTVDHYEVPTDARSGLRYGARVADCGYETPMDARQNGGCGVGSDDYELMWSESGPAHRAEETRKVIKNEYYKVGQLETSPTHPWERSDPIKVPPNVHDVPHTDNSLTFMQSVVHQLASL